ncbi:MAG TPA: helix-turn-helix transcriptional regulator [Allosphingosinicella sp.]|nr:helix-turn-helix transcriptional regulator [Allosphingosinicella sp.]
MSQKRRTRADEPFLTIRTLAYRVEAGHRIERHRHDWHQLVYASAGLLNVWTERGAWIVPPHWAIWVPAGVTHSIRFAAPSDLRTLYLRPRTDENVPVDCAVIGVSALLRALILRTVAENMLDQRDPVEAALATLILDEFRQAGAPPFDLPRPASPALARAAALIEADAPAAATTAALASAVGLGTRTLERRFLAETGLTPGRWRRQHLLLGALERLAAGAPIKQVAAAAGYATPSAFTAAFRAGFGTTPARYFAERRPGLPDGAASA